MIMNDNPDLDLLKEEVDLHVQVLLEVLVEQVPDEFEVAPFVLSVLSLSTLKMMLALLSLEDVKARETNRIAFLQTLEHMSEVIATEGLPAHASTRLN